MTTSTIQWLPPSVPDSVLVMDAPPNGKRPKWFPPGLSGQVLLIDEAGRLAWGAAPAGLPVGGDPGDVLTIVDGEPEWAPPTAGALDLIESTKAGLPTPGSPGLLRHVTDDVRGIWMDTGTHWFPTNAGVINVREFGATGDGTTDDTAALTAAVAAGQGKTIHFPAGTYKITSALTLTGWGTRVTGVGAESVLAVAAAVDGLVITNFWASVANLYLVSHHATAAAAIRLTAGAANFQNVWIASSTGCTWSKGYHYDGDTVGHTTVVGGHVQGNIGGGITTLFYLDTLSGGNAFVNALGTGHASGTATARGVYSLRGGSFSWVGGVLEGGFSQAVVDIDGTVGSATIAALYNLYIECNAGPLIAVRYNNSVGTLDIVGASIQNDIHVGTAGVIGAYGFRLDGGIVGNVVLGTLAFNPVVSPSALISLTDSGATRPVFGPYRVIGSSISEPARYPDLRIATAGLAHGALLSAPSNHYLFLKNGTSGQTFRIYETDDGAGNAAFLEFSGTFNTISTVSQGSVPARNLTIGGNSSIYFLANNVVPWVLDVSGILYPSPDATRDIGINSLRVRTIYLSDTVNLRAGPAAATPPTGSVVLYAKADKKLYAKNDAGTETALW